MIADVKAYLLDLQNRICQIAEQEEEKTLFHEDEWQHHQGGGGRTRVLAGGNVIEKAGVNFSHVSGKSLPHAATIRRPELLNAAFQALGVSVVMHPYNPYIPTSHLNVRFIEVKTEEKTHWWFGGGFDLTPYYGFTEDCVHWHKTAEMACQPFGVDIYAKFKKWCDDYFFLKHRNEPRGIGGIFYDDLHAWSFAQCFAFMRSVGDHYIKAYQPILARRKLHPFSTKERDFQRYRRGRYVEFNLLYDRGTLFGLQSGGRTESILMSLPPEVTWIYAKNTELLTAEKNLYDNFLKPREWLG